MESGNGEDSAEDVNFHFRDLVDVVFGYAASDATFEELRYFKQRMTQVLDRKSRGETPLRSQHMYRPTRGGRRRQNGS